MQTQEDIDQDIIEECCQECDVEERNTPDNTNLAVMNAVGATPTTLPNTDSQQSAKNHPNQIAQDVSNDLEVYQGNTQRE